jgi:hypothetical protein
LKIGWRGRVLVCRTAEKAGSLSGFWQSKRKCIYCFHIHGVIQNKIGDYLLKMKFVCLERRRFFLQMVIRNGWVINLTFPGTDGFDNQLAQSLPENQCDCWSSWDFMTCLSFAEVTATSVNKNEAVSVSCF